MPQRMLPCARDMRMRTLEGCVKVRYPHSHLLNRQVSLFASVIEEAAAHGQQAQECCRDRRPSTAQGGLEGAALPCPPALVHPALFVASQTAHELNMRKRQVMESAPVVAALEAAAGEHMDAAKERDSPAIAAAVALASGTGAADDAAVEGRARINCPLEHCSLHCARARAPQPAPLCTCRLGCTLAWLPPSDRAVCASTRV